MSDTPQPDEQKPKDVKTPEQLAQEAMEAKYVNHPAIIRDAMCSPQLPLLEELVDILCARTQNSDRHFFRVEVVYFLAKMASCMRVNVATKDRGSFPVNIYAMALAGSGYGKGYSVYLMEQEIIKGFANAFLHTSLPDRAAASLDLLADYYPGEDRDETRQRLQADYDRTGTYAFTFDSGTVPAVKQLRHKLLLAKAGSVNLQIDEIGSNLINSKDLLDLFLELYDQGLVKQKLTKNTAENVRSMEVDGKTPTNMLLFGTPATLMDGGPTEDQFYSALEAGYARRCLFALGKHVTKDFSTLDAAKVYNDLTNLQKSGTMTKWYAHFTDLADPANFDSEIEIPDNLGIMLTEYKLYCEMLSDRMQDHVTIQKAEMQHRYFKVAKLAALFAWIEGGNMELSHLQAAIRLVEESGEDFHSILNREKPYVKLARFITSSPTEVTHADLHEALPFYKTGQAARNEMITMAIAWAYKQHMVIRKSFTDGIEFFSGEKLEEADLSKCLISASTDLAEGYDEYALAWDELINLGQQTDLHWCNHLFTAGHRTESNAIPGFNLIVVDVDGTARLSAVREMMSRYKYIIYTTKRHTEEENRFRMIFPINYKLKLDKEEFTQFMENFVQWLPFTVDESTLQRSRKWLSNNDHAEINDGLVMDALPFIPRTSKNAELQAEMSKVRDLDNLERWFAQEMSQGSRNNNMLRYALILVDNGVPVAEIQKKVLNLNSRLTNPLPVSEIQSTIFQTVAKKAHEATNEQ